MSNFSFFLFFKRRLHNHRTSSRSVVKGQGMVEFALALPVLLLLLMGVIEFGRMLMTYSAVFSAGREASRYGAAVGLNTLGVPFDHDCDGMRAAAVRVGNLGGVKTSNVSIRMLGSDGQPKIIDGVVVGDNWCTVNNNNWATVLGDIVEVTVAVNYAPVVPLVPIPQLTVSGDSGGIRSTSSRTIIKGVEVPSTANNGSGGSITYTVTVNYNPANISVGSVTPSTAVNNPDVGPYMAGTVVHLTPNAVAGWHFAGWSGPDGTQVDASNNITIDMSKTVTANFVQDPFALVMSQVGSGTINPPVGASLIAAGSQVTLSATPASGWSFVGWSGTDISGNANPVTITMDKPKNIIATFTNSQKYNLTTSVTGSGSVSPASGSFTFGDVISMVATPSDACWAFTSWKVNGVDRGNANPLSVTITGATSVVATFQANPFSLTTYASTLPANQNGGAITLDPPGGSYTCTPAGMTVNLTAQPQPGWTFFGWSGADSTNGLTATVNLTLTQPNRTVTATFSQLYILNTNTSGSGSVLLDPPGGNYPYDPLGRTVNLTAQPAPGWAFASWTGVDAANGASATVNLTPAQPVRTVSASFTQEQYTLTVSVQPPSTGTFTVNPNTNRFLYGQSVNVSPTAIRGYGFSSWGYAGVNNAVVNPDNSITINPITGNMPLTLSFVPVCAPTEKIVETQITSGSASEIWYMIDNSTAMDVNIDQIAVKWAKNKTLVKVSLNGQVIWANSVGVSSIAILNSSALTNDLTKRRLPAYSTFNKLAMTFSGNDSSVGYEMMAITYSNSCQ